MKTNQKCLSSSSPASFGTGLWLSSCACELLMTVFSLESCSLLTCLLVAGLFFFSFSVSRYLTGTDFHSLDKLDKRSWLDSGWFVHFWDLILILIELKTLCLWVFGLCRALYPWPRDVSFQTWRSLIDLIYYFVFFDWFTLQNSILLNQLDRLRSSSDLEFTLWCCISWED